MKTTAFFIMALTAMQLQAQFINNGSSIYIDAGAVVTIDHSLNGLAGAEIVNNGKLYVSGNVVNDATPDFFKKKSSTGTLILNGSTQTLSGKNDIWLNNLELNKDVKKLHTNLFVSNQLELGDAVMNAENVTLQILNPDPSAISRNTGYISTQQDAQLIRNTDAQRKYLFPVGSLNQQYYQPVEIITANADKGSFAVTLHDYSADAEGYDLQSKDALIEEVNDQYFYTISRVSGNDNAGIVFYNDSAKDSGFQGIGLWSTGENKWIAPQTPATEAGVFGADLNRSMLVVQQDFTNTQYTTVRNSATPEKSKLIQIPNSFSSNSDGLNDFWEIKGIEKFPDNNVYIYNRWGELIFETKGYSNSNHFDASNLMQGVYMYIVEVRDNKGYHKSYTGDLTILR